MVAEDDDKTLVVVWVLVAVLFDYQTGHGWDGVGCVAFTSEATITFSVYHGVDVVIYKTLFLILIALYPSVLVRMILVCLYREGCRAVA